MAKRFKFRLSLPSLQMCRSREASSLPHSPLPITFMCSHIDHQEFDVSYTNFPKPPPSTPDRPSKIVPVNQALRSTSCISHMSRLSNEDDSFSRLYNSPVSDYSDIDEWPIAHSKSETKKKNSSIKKSKSRLNTSTSAETTDGFTSDEHNEETESLISSSSSFSSSYDSGNTSEFFSRRKKKNGKVQRSKHDASSSWMNDEERQATATSENICQVRKSSIEWLIPRMEDGKVNESYAVVKRSKDPYEDFKMSMMEMIIDKKMFEAKDLEELLFRFLSLNSQQHHAAIVDAFTEVWDTLFAQSPKF